jgi:hypothetical protein
MTTAPAPNWHRTLADLLTGKHLDELPDGSLPGAQIVVTDADGRELFGAALARHSRVDTHNHNLVWIRPLPERDHDLATGAPVLDLEHARRRGLAVLAAHARGVDLEVTLINGQVARIQPAVGDQLGHLQAWDTWVLGLPSRLRAELDKLDADR